MLRALVGVTCRADSSLARVANEARKIILKESGSIGSIRSSSTVGTVDGGGWNRSDGNGSNISSSNDEGGGDGACIEYNSQRNDTKQTMYQSRNGDDEWVLRCFEDLVVRDRSSADVDVDIVEGVVGKKGSQDVVSVINGTKDEVTTQDKIREAHAKFMCS